MDDSAASRNTATFGLALGVCAVLNAVLVVAKERSKGFQAWLQRLTGNNWVSHAAIVLVAFLVIGWGLGRTHGGKWPAVTFRGLTRFVVAGVLAGLLIIVGFYGIAD